ncbi:MAG: DNA/RNA non-specific endonuclease [Muribaculaceae bacterium]|nr:DNA/RNA non-specific endonuclease [Muribaculaceae bacterium]
MGKRSRKKSNSLGGWPILILGVCALLIGVGCFMALGSGCSEQRGIIADEPSPLPGNPAGTSGVKHYPGLETVNLPEKLPSQVKEYIGFTISFNKENKTPNYVAWELLAEETQGDSQRSNNFWTDSDLEGCPSTKDYTGSGFDRGHLCPAADQKWSQQAMSDCFVMGNICPQDHSLNTGAWNTLENKERQWAQRDSAIMIVAGPIYTDSDKQRIGNAGVRVPGAFFKVFAAPYLDEPRGIAFVYPNMKASGNMENYAMSIDELEKITGYDFFPALPDKIEDKIESAYSFREWNSSK